MQADLYIRAGIQMLCIPYHNLPYKKIEANACYLSESGWVEGGKFQSSPSYAALLSTIFLWGKKLNFRAKRYKYVLHIFD